ncbi:MAG: hypothetical protein LC135_01975 [Phycisphaerae bacterium]|nr:hypothetical protein [Phycisphaerae bacterium]MCZ2398622.1 hypothetical protein [Phycisphaerae bacterium]
MLIRGRPATVLIYAYDLDTGAPVSGDAANISAALSLDGGEAEALAAPAEVDAAALPGWYAYALDADQTDADVLLLAAASSTSGVTIDPVVERSDHGLIRRLHALAWGTKHIVDLAAPAVRRVRDEADQADLMTLTSAVAGTTHTITPAPPSP